MSKKTELTESVFLDLYIQKSLSLSDIGRLYGISRQNVYYLKKQLESRYKKNLTKKRVDLYDVRKLLDSGHTIKSTANQLGVSPHTIYKIIKQQKNILNHERFKTNVIKKKKVEDKIAKEVLLSYYVDQKLTDKEISRIFGVSASSIGNLRKMYGIGTNYAKKLRKITNYLSRDEFERLYYDQKIPAKKIARKYRCSVDSLLSLYGVRPYRHGVEPPT